MLNEAYISLLAAPKKGKKMALNEFLEDEGKIPASAVDSPSSDDEILQLSDRGLMRWKVCQQHVSICFTPPT